MKKLFLIKNPELFQGEKYLKTNKNYFEGWYFKNTNNKNTISFIPGININEYEKKAFIQIITTYSSYFVNYNIEDFKFSFEPFCIKIDNNLFYKNSIHIDIKDDTQNLVVLGDIRYSNGKNICTNFLNSNIMGPFSYVPFQNSNASFMISIADISFKFFHFKGIICDLIIDNDEFKFTTYNNTKLVKYDVNDDLLDIT